MNNSRIPGLIFLTLFLAYGYFATAIPLDYFSLRESFNARTLPLIISLCGAVISLLLILAPPTPDEDADGPGNSAGTDHSPLHILPAVLLLLSMSFYGLILDRLGFVVSTLLFLCAGAVILGERRPLQILLASVPLVTGFWILMSLLGISLPSGDWFAFTETAY